MSKHKVECTCGMKFRSKIEFTQHYLIGLPTVPIRSRLTSKYITEGKINEARAKLREYKAKHQLVK